MTSYFKKKIFILVSIAVFFNGCFHYEEPESNGFTPVAQVYADRILAENHLTKYEVNVNWSSASSGLSNPVGYYLVLRVNDTVTLTNTIDSMRLYGTYRFDKVGGGTGGGMVDLPFLGINVECDTLDSIRINTGTVICLGLLDLGKCNLTHLPPEIGKVRVQSLDLTNNNLTTLPLEIMQLLDPPKCYSYTVIDWSSQKNFSFNSLPDTLKNWFNNVYYKQDFKK